MLFDGSNSDCRHELDSGINHFMMAVCGDTPGASRRVEIVAHLSVVVLSACAPTSSRSALTFVR